MSTELRYKQQGTSIPYGGGKQLNDAARSTRPAPGTRPEATPGSAIPSPGQAPSPELTPRNEMEALLAGPPKTGLPLTAGAPFGAGSMGIPPMDEDERLATFVRSLATPDAPPEIHKFAERIERGE